MIYRAEPTYTAEWKSNHAEGDGVATFEVADCAEVFVLPHVKTFDAITRLLDTVAS